MISSPFFVSFRLETKNASLFRKDMKRFLLLILALAAAWTASAADNIRFASRPSLSPDGKQVYFSYDGDIYSVPAVGGQAAAVITMPGVQDAPLVSPDGKWLAFSSDIQGNNGSHYHFSKKHLNPHYE